MKTEWRAGLSEFDSGLSTGSWEFERKLEATPCNSYKKLVRRGWANGKRALVRDEYPRRASFNFNRNLSVAGGVLR